MLGIYGAKGGIEIAIGSAGAAGLLTVGTGGAAAEISVPAGITGVVAGIGTTVVGLEGAAIAAGNLGSDLAMMQGSGGTESGNWNKVDDKYLKKKGIDAHELKRNNLGQKAPISKYDTYVDKNTGELFIFEKGGSGTGIPTGEFIK